jgi:bifunctional DNA-binding transcriptional regulator/antitoxin component of YhaV-PrlF toxin-antitoxin module
VIGLGFYSKRMAQGVVGGKYQLTPPVEVRKALGIEPGDRVEDVVKGGRLEIRVIRPDLSQVLAEHDFTAWWAETQDDALRGRDD